MQKLILNLFIIVFVTITITAQEVRFPMLKGYKLKSGGRVFTPDNIGDLLGREADNYLTYGLMDARVAVYKKGRAGIRAEIFRLADNLLAFGIYSAERVVPPARFVNLGAQGYVNDGSINFFKGSYYVRITANSARETVIRSAESLAARVAQILPGETTMPSLLSWFPSNGKKNAEELFISEKILGHSFLKRGFRASYQLGNDNFFIYIIEKESAAEARETAETYIASAGISPVTTGDNKFVLMDGYNGTIFLAWEGNKIAIISGLAKDQSDIADRYITEIFKQ